MLWMIWSRYGKLNMNKWAKSVIDRYTELQHSKSVMVRVFLKDAYNYALSIKAREQELYDGIDRAEPVFFHALLYNARQEVPQRAVV